MCNFHITFATSISTSFTDDSYVPFQAWILHHFPRIFGWSCLPTYTENMPHASTFIPLRENHVKETYQVYLDYLVAKDIPFHTYVTNRETCPFNDITLYFGWLTCGSLLTYPHLPGRIMRQFIYMQLFPETLLSPLLSL